PRLADSARRVFLPPAHEAPVLPLRVRAEVRKTLQELRNRAAGRDRQAPLPGRSWRFRYRCSAKGTASVQLNFPPASYLQPCNNPATAVAGKHRGTANHLPALVLFHAYCRRRNRNFGGFIMRFSSALLIGTSVIAVAMPAAAAQTGQEQAAQAANNQPAVQDEGAIIVTATKRASTVQDVPFSVNAQTQEDIERAHAQTIEDISRNVAGLTVQNLGPGQSQVSVRGVSAGQVVRDQPGVKEQVGV